MVSEQHAVLCEGLSIAVSRLFETDSVWACSLLHLLCGIYEMTSSKVRPVGDLDGRIRRIGSRTTGSGSSYFSEQPISGAYVNSVVYGVGPSTNAERGRNRR